MKSPESRLRSILLFVVFASFLVSLAVADLIVDLNYDGKVNIVDVYIVAKAFGSKSGDPRWNSDLDFNSNGVVDIVDVVTVAMHFGKTFVHVNSSFGSQWGRLDLFAEVVSNDSLMLNLTFNALHNYPQWRFRIDIREAGTPPGLNVGMLPDGLELVSGTTVWEGYNDVAQVSIRATTKVVKDGEWEICGLALRVEGNWTNYGALDGFGSGMIRIIVSNMTITSIVAEPY